MARLTEARVRDLTLPAAGEQTAWDSELRGFGLRTRPGGSKTWVLKYRTSTGRQRKATLGAWPVLSAEEARRQARRMLGLVAAGRDPVADENRQLRAVTLRQAFEDYLGTRRTLKPTSVTIYRNAIGERLSDWTDLPLAAITSDAVIKRHATLTADSGPALANLVMRILGAVLNFAMEKYADELGEPLLARNPVRKLSTFKAWNPMPRRQTVIRPHELRRWYQAVESLKNRTGADYLTLVIFTGLRRQEAASLAWRDVDFPGQTLTIRETKNGKPHTLPLGPCMMNLLKRRRAASGSPWVFPSERGELHLSDPTTIVERVTKASGVRFIMHDLRRTFITVAESLDVPSYALKRLLNHGDNDVTAGYLVIDTERLRRPMEAIERCLMTAMGIEALTATEAQPV